MDRKTMHLLKYGSLRTLKYRCLFRSFERRIDSSLPLSQRPVTRVSALIPYPRHTLLLLLLLYYSLH